MIRDRLWRVATAVYVEPRLLPLILGLYGVALMLFIYALHILDAREGRVIA